MTPILSFLPCAGASGVSDRPNTSVAAISPHTKRTDRYGNIGPSQRASVGNGSARALEVGRRTMSSGWTADLRTHRECDAGNIVVHMNALCRLSLSSGFLAYCSFPFR